MKLKELFAAVTTDPDFEGFITTDQVVLAIDTSPKQDSDVDEFDVAYMGFTDKSSSLNPKEKTSSYYYHGESTDDTFNFAPLRGFRDNVIKPSFIVMESDPKFI